MTAPGFGPTQGVGHLATVCDEDVRAAQVVIDAWTAGWTHWLPVDLLELRGILAGQFADVRAAGYLAGHSDATDLATQEPGPACLDGKGGHVFDAAYGTCDLCGAEP